MSIKPGSIIFMAGVAALAAGGGYWAASRNTPPPPGPQATQSGRQVLYWYDPMAPGQRFDKPGKSPFMDMELIPKYADEAEGHDAALSIDPVSTQNLGVRMATVEEATLAPLIEAVGSIVFNQRDVAIVQSRTRGIVARIYGRAPGDVLERGAPLVDLLVPEWSSAESEFLALRKQGDAELVAAARERLRLLGLPQDAIDRLESGDAPHVAFTVRAPIAGALESLEAREGMAVGEGATLARINGLGSVWMEAAIPESRGSVGAAGKAAEVRLTAFPGEVLRGRTVAVLPQADNETRTLRVRVELDNPSLKLRPGLFGQVRFAAGDARAALYVASEAIIRTGERDVAILTDGRGHFTPQEVRIGREIDGKTEILSGLKAGDRVVASGQFLIDSEANLKSALARMSEPRP